MNSLLMKEAKKGKVSIESNGTIDQLKSVMSALGSDLNDSELVLYRYFTNVEIDFNMFMWVGSDKTDMDTVKVTDLLEGKKKDVNSERFKIACDIAKGIVSNPYLGAQYGDTFVESVVSLSFQIADELLENK